MITDDIATITPRQGDDEERFLDAAVETLTVFVHYLARAARARGVRTVTAEDLEHVQDEALELQRGLNRALERRRRDLGAATKWRELAPQRAAGGGR